MLALGTHEPHFKVLREDVFADDKKGCRICGKNGHIAAHCKGKQEMGDKGDKWIVITNNDML